MQASVSFVIEIRDLGILTDNKLAMSQHICTVVKKARTTASLIFKCFHSRHRASYLKAFTTYLRPLLEYATPVWSPYIITNITKIESVERSFTKRLLGLSNLPYTKHLEFLGIDSLELLRLCYGLVFVYKMLFGLVDLKFSDYFTLRANSTTRGHDYKLFQTYSRFNVRKHFFAKELLINGTILNV